MDRHISSREGEEEEDPLEEKLIVTLSKFTAVINLSLSGQN